MRHIATLTLLGLLAGCGQTGPLYQPGEEPERRTTMPGGTAPQESTEEN
ncbi:MAG: lipoprotein [Halioglobus sp.]